MSLSGIAGLCLYARAAAGDAASDSAIDSAIDWWAGESSAPRDTTRAAAATAWLAGDSRLGG
jgi:hypothetical protein